MRVLGGLSVSLLSSSGLFRDGFAFGTTPLQPGGSRVPTCLIHHWHIVTSHSGLHLLAADGHHHHPWVGMGECVPLSVV